MVVVERVKRVALVLPGQESGRNIAPPGIAMGGKAGRGNCQIQMHVSHSGNFPGCVSGCMCVCAQCVCLW